MGTTIDFEQKKIIQGSTEIILNGTEAWSRRDIDPSKSDGGSKRRFGVSLSVASKNVGADKVNSVSSVYPSVSPDASWGGTQGVTVDGTNLYLFDEAFATKTEEEFKAHLAELADANGANNPVTVRYFVAMPTETNFTAQQSARGNEYTVSKGGMENVLDNDGEEYGAVPTVTTNYLFKVGGNE
jgi:hypothetical protein